MRPARHRGSRRRILGFAALLGPVSRLRQVMQGAHYEKLLPRKSPVLARRSYGFTGAFLATEHLWSP
ncbi:MAG: hypothetical protein ACRDQ5_10375, partial [Sciscionella sp.]